MNDNHAVTVAIVATDHHLALVVSTPECQNSNATTGCLTYVPLFLSMLATTLYYYLSKFIHQLETV